MGAPYGNRNAAGSHKAFTKGKSKTRKSSSSYGKKAKGLKVNLNLLKPSRKQRSNQRWAEQYERNLNKRR